VNSCKNGNRGPFARERPSKEPVFRLGRDVCPEGRKGGSGWARLGDNDLGGEGQTAKLGSEISGFRFVKRKGRPDAREGRGPP